VPLGASHGHVQPPVLRQEADLALGSIL
jgi:hypothetical protein